MRLLWYLVVAPVAAVGIVVGGVLLQSHAALTPMLESPDVKQAAIPTAKSLSDLYQIRDRLQAEIDSQPPTLVATASGVMGSAPTQTFQALQAVEVRIEIEETAQARWQEALKLGSEAAAMGSTISPTSASETQLGELHSRWKTAVDTLRSIPAESFIAAQATKKLKNYEANLAAAGYYYDTIRSDFLRDIAESTGLESRVHITVCNLERECRRLRGNEPPASPASLIKVPVAVALMHKLATENISLEQKLLVSPGNWTEDAGKIWVGKEYPIGKIMEDMIMYSGNIATNQLIEYMGFDYINRVLSDRGYNATRVNTKLVGESTYPSNPGSGPNTMTTDELTDMMVGIYNFEHPGDQAILDALVKQYDWELGYEAVKRPAVWIGEKTGQNSKVLGSTTGVNIKGERYIITVTIDYTGSEPAVKQCIKGVVDYILNNGGL